MHVLSAQGCYQSLWHERDFVLLSFSLYGLQPFLVPRVRLVASRGQNQVETIDSKLRGDGYRALNPSLERWAMSSTHDQSLQNPYNSAHPGEPDGVRFKELLSHAPTAIAFLSGPEFRFSYANDLYVRAMGRSEGSELLGRTVREALPELVDSEIFHLLDKVCRNGTPHRETDFKVTLQPAVPGLGEERYFDFILQPTFDQAGNYEGVFVVAVDLTDRVLSRRAVDLSEERLRLAQEAAQIGTWEWDPVENTRTLSKQMHRMYGTDPNASNEDIHRIWLSRVFSRDLPYVNLAMAECQRTGGLDLEYRYDHPEMGLRHHYSKGRRMMGTSRFFGVVTDITDRKRMETSLSEREQTQVESSLEAIQRLAAIVESSDDAIISKDLNGIVKSWNPGAERVFGYTAAEMIGQSVLKIIPTELHAEEDRIMSAVARGERTEHFETMRIRKDGEQIEVSLTLSPVVDSSGKTTGVASISRDVSQQKKVERALHTSERLATVGRLAATIAHEINNPLEAVTNLVFLAQTSMHDPDGRMFLEQAQQELARMALLTKQTLGFYRETRGARPLTLGELVTPLVAVFSARARNKQVSIATDIRENPTMVGFPGELRQLFANLLNNSIDAVRDHGRILIRVSAARECAGQERAGVRLTVCDNGPGIAFEVRQKLFEPFFTTKRDVGTGLGLWVTSNILRKHEGTIRVRSSVTSGRSWTVFSVFLPLRSESVAATT